jgi:hypothetical protein
MPIRMVEEETVILAYNLSQFRGLLLALEQSLLLNKIGKRLRLSQGPRKLSKVST